MKNNETKHLILTFSRSKMDDDTLLKSSTDLLVIDILLSMFTGHDKKQLLLNCKSVAFVQTIKT